MALTISEIKIIIEKVPAAEKNMPALVVDNKILTWKEILHNHVERNSAVMGKIISEIEEIRKKCEEKRFDFEIDLSENEISLARQRLSSMPSDMRIITLGTMFAKKDLIKQLDDKTSLGSRIARRELNYVATLWSK